MTIKMVRHWHTGDVIVEPDIDFGEFKSYVATLHVVCSSHRWYLGTSSYW